MIEPIKRDFGASDTQVSLLVGMSFSVFYLTCGLLIARLADHRNRRNILAIGASIWSVMTAACGAAQSFSQLLISRMGVGVGEGSIAPCGQSIIADEVPQESLGKAISLYSIGALVGSLLAYILGGLLLGWTESRFAGGVTLPAIGHIFGWQLTFLLLGLPGLGLALIFALTVREPIRRQAAVSSSTLRGVLRFMLKHRALYIALFTGGIVTQAGAAAAATWFPALLARKFGLGPDVAGPVLAGSLAIPGVASAILGGWIADRLRRQGILDSYARLAVYGSVLGFLPFGLSPLMTSVGWLAALAALGTFCNFMTQPLTLSALQAVSPGHMRATVAALYGALSTLLAWGLSPLFVALLTDYAFANEQALDRSVAIVISLCLLMAGAAFQQARAPLSRALQDL